MVKALRAFLEFCYIARRNVHDTWSLKELDDTLQRYHHYCELPAFKPGLISLANMLSSIILKRFVNLVL